MLNKQGPGKIDWTGWTWNPISGCLHGCYYCYMRRMEKRFPGIMKPMFHFDRIDKFLRSKKVKSGEKVFVGSSGDMWGEWVIEEWISAVLDVVELVPDVTFQFLTKNPRGYRYWNFHDNCWLGATVDGTERTEANIEYLLRSVSEQYIRFISFEPILAPVFVRPEQWEALDWIIIGADSNKGADKPPKSWATALIYEANYHGVPVWVKDNYEYPEIIKEFPQIKKGVA